MCRPIVCPRTSTKAYYEQDTMNNIRSANKKYCMARVPSVPNKNAPVKIQEFFFLFACSISCKSLNGLFVVSLSVRKKRTKNPVLAGKKATEPSCWKIRCRFRNMSIDRLLFISKRHRN